ncbi:hypothetical protein KHC23_00910 [Ancylobacter dichloromethanicus]|nr:hypothetical protein [Ancylobacter dichloromethanicus]MBS7552219.1 hypothetical protein [Ancylobacter dichloromethanicus]
MEMLYGVGALLLLAVMAYAIRQSQQRRKAKGIELPEEKVDRNSPL